MSLALHPLDAFETARRIMRQKYVLGRPAVLQLAPHIRTPEDLTLYFRQLAQAHGLDTVKVIRGEYEGTPTILPDGRLRAQTLSGRITWTLTVSPPQFSVEWSEAHRHSPTGMAQSWLAGRHVAVPNDVDEHFIPKVVGELLLAGFTVPEVIALSPLPDVAIYIALGFVLKQGVSPARPGDPAGGLYQLVFKEMMRRPQNQDLKRSG